MPQATQETYAGSCNPARRAKTRTDTTPPKKPSTISPVSHQPRVILPLPTRNIDNTPNPDEDTAIAAPPPAKRGRKPGPLSRAARETQRKLNHSIIEKARRTKINDALARLRELVPADYGSKASKADKDLDKDEDAEEDDEHDKDGEWKKNKEKKKSTKREEKEKEFKLEILVRTVSFMEELLERVKKLEEGSSAGSDCQRCSSQAQIAKRRHDQVDQDTHQHGSMKRSRGESTPSDIESVQEHQLSPLPTQRPQAYLGSRLPSISSWLLPNSAIDPLPLSPLTRRLSPSSSAGTPSITSNIITQLPSPPASTHFAPLQPAQIPPTLNLGPVATSALLSPRRTPDDESAATLLLQISGSSPQLLPVVASMSSPRASFDMSKMRTACKTPVTSDYRARGGQAHVGQAQTPGSILGMMKRS